MTTSQDQTQQIENLQKRIAELEASLAEAGLQEVRHRIDLDFMPAAEFEKLKYDAIYRNGDTLEIFSEKVLEVLEGDIDR